MVYVTNVYQLPLAFVQVAELLSQDSLNTFILRKFREAKHLETEVAAFLKTQGGDHLW